MVALSGVPGMETTTLVPPWVLISASETPAESMRWRMIVTAWFSCSAVTVFPFSSFGARMICVPPSRSNASFGAQLPFCQRMPAPLSIVKPATITRSQVRERHAFLTGVVLATEELSFLEVIAWDRASTHAAGASHDSYEARSG